MSTAIAARFSRGAGLACLALLALAGGGAFRADSDADRVAVRGARDDGAAGWATALAAPAGVPAARTDEAEPDGAELAALAALASRRPLALRLPPPGPALVLEVAGPLARGRRGALTVTVRGQPGAAVPVVVSDDRGGADSVTVMVGADGIGATSLGIRPAAAGWRGWSARAGGATARAAAWVEGAPPPRVALLGGPDGWETRFAARALEEGGLDVSVRVPLGRAGPVRGGPTGGADSADVVLVLPGAEVGAEEARALAGRVLGEGAGVLVVGFEAPALAAALGLAGRPRALAARSATWAAGADLPPPPVLPTADPALRLLGADPPPGARAAGRAGGAATYIVRPAGRGRAAWSGHEETWRARLDGASVEAHRDHWVALAEWLAAGRLAGARFAFDPAEPAPGDLVRVRPLGDATLDGLAVVGPGGEEPGPAGAPPPRAPRPASAPFVAADTGVYALVGAAGDTLLATRADARPASRHGFGRAALLAHASGGVAASAPELADWLGARGAPVRDPSELLEWLLFAGALAGFLAAWALRRARGLP